jgi:hypothetical protein
MRKMRRLPTLEQSGYLAHTVRMTLEVDLTPEQELWLRQIASRAGVDQQAALLAMIDRQRAADDPLAGLSEDENQLQLEISRELPLDVRQRYVQLSRKCQEETLTAAEHRELIELIDIIETNHAARVSRVLKLAQLRGVSFDTVTFGYAS